MCRWIILILVAALFGVRTAWADTRWVVTQSTSSDCGPAALATLLKYYLDVPTSEREMEELTGVKTGVGTTFLKLQEAAEKKGCSAEAFRMNWETLQQQMRTYPAPMIVRLLLPQPHFVVLLGIEGDNVFLADPAQGNLILRKDAFLPRWYYVNAAQPEGFVFIATGPDDYINEKRHRQMVQALRTQLHMLKNLRPPLPLNRIGR
jgi:ABC-type bacteriocin/lantibiotic exporter with double-glycine peptidase domain